MLREATNKALFLVARPLRCWQLSKKQTWAGPRGVEKAENKQQSKNQTGRLDWGGRKSKKIGSAKRQRFNPNDRVEPSTWY